MDTSHGWHGHLDILQHKLDGIALPAFENVWREGRYDRHYA